MRIPASQSQMAAGGAVRAGVSIRDQLRKLVDDLDDNTVKLELLAVIDTLDDAFLPALLAYTRVHSRLSSRMGCHVAMKTDQVPVAADCCAADCCLTADLPGMSRHTPMMAERAFSVALSGLVATDADDPPLAVDLGEVHVVDPPARFCPDARIVGVMSRTFTEYVAVGHTVGSNLDCLRKGLFRGGLADPLVTRYGQGARGCARPPGRRRRCLQCCG